MSRRLRRSGGAALALCALALAVAPGSGLAAGSSPRIVGGGKANEYIYTYSDAELHRVLADLEKKGRRVKDPVQRYKGLGEMDASQLRETTMDPRQRTLRRVRVSDAAAAESVFELLMGGEVAPRKEFIVEGAGGLDRSRIDA